MNIIERHTLRTGLLSSVYSIVMFSLGIVHCSSKLNLMHCKGGWFMLVGWWLVVLGGSTGATARDGPKYE